jgi:hypothetical protein
VKRTIAGFYKESLTVTNGIARCLSEDGRANQKKVETGDPIRKVKRRECWDSVEGLLEKRSKDY